MSLRESRARLGQAFRAILVAAAGAAALEAACTDDAASPAADAGIAPAPPATTGPGADDGALADTTDASADAFDAAACKATYYFDATFTDVAEDAQICQIDLPCGLPNNLRMEGCQVISLADDATVPCRARETRGCTADAADLSPGAPMTMDCLCDLFAGGGRRHAGFRGRRVRAPSALGAYFGAAARLEAESVPAFERLEHELALFGAPRELVRAARTARRDEIRHTGVMDRLARRHGAKKVAPAKDAPKAPRSLRDFARENAVEGCVRETYGALALHWQAEHATDPEVRRALARVAADETAHASLAWAIAEWAEGALDPASRRAVAAARRRAVRSLRRALERPAPREVVAIAGAPDRATALRLLDALALA